MLDASDREWIDDETLVSALRGETDESLRTALYHVHLPKLADAGVVERNREATQVKRGPNHETVHAFRRRSGEPRKPNDGAVSR